MIDQESYILGSHAEGLPVRDIWLRSFDALNLLPAAYACNVRVTYISSQRKIKPVLIFLYRREIWFTKCNMYTTSKRNKENILFCVIIQMHNNVIVSL